MDGTEPPEANNAKAYRVRPGDFMLPRDVPVVDGAKEILPSNSSPCHPGLSRDSHQAQRSRLPFDKLRVVQL